MDIAQPNPTKRRWLRFSLRSLLIATTLAGSLFGWVTYQIRRGREIAMAIAQVQLRDFTYQSPVPEWMRSALGKYFLATITCDEGMVNGTPVNLAHIRRLKLRRLVLIGVQLSDAEFADFEGMESLQSLDLFEVEVGDVGLDHLQRMAGLRSLKLTGKGDDFISRVKKMQNLTDLYLDNSSATDPGLAHLKSMTNLVSLSLSGTQVSDTGLANISGLNNLVRLSLDRTSVSDAGLVHLYGLTNLEYLNLLDTSATTDGVHKLRRALPNCEIVLTGHEPRRYRP